MDKAATSLTPSESSQTTLAQTDGSREVNISGSEGANSSSIVPMREHSSGFVSVGRGRASSPPPPKSPSAGPQPLETAAKGELKASGSAQCLTIIIRALKEESQQTNFELSEDLFKNYQENDKKVAIGLRKTINS